MNNTNFLFWLILIPLIASPIVYIVGRLETRSNKLPKIARWLAIIALAAAYIPLFLASKSVLNGEAIIYQMNAISMELDGIALLFSAWSSPYVCWLLSSQQVTCLAKITKKILRPATGYERRHDRSCLCTRSVQLMGVV